MKILLVIFFIALFPTQALASTSEANFLHPKITKIHRFEFCVQENSCEAVLHIYRRNFLNSNDRTGVMVGDEWATILNWTSNKIVVATSLTNKNKPPIISMDTKVVIPELKTNDTVLTQMFDESVQVALDSIHTDPEGNRYIAAGSKYDDPQRTYFRDSYWTSGLVLLIEPYVVRDQIITLARGVNEDGSTPSAVTINPNDYQLPLWTNHYDSGAYFIMMVYDYIRFTGDKSVLDDVINDRSIFTIMEDVVSYLSVQDLDGNLLPEKPENSLQDWLDTIPRSGEVLSNEVLYYRALRNMYEMANLYNEPEHALSFHRHSLLVRFQINDLFWIEEKGYFNESCYKGECVERLTNESSLAILYDVIYAENREKLFTSLLNLETKRNSEMLYGDWGVLNAFPLYSNMNAYKYQNGTDWPFLDGMNAGARLKYSNSDWYYPLTRWWTYFNENKEQGQLLPEFVSPIDQSHGLSQAWSVNPMTSFVRYGLGIDPDIDGNYQIKTSPDGSTILKNIVLRGARRTIQSK